MTDSTYVGGNAVLITLDPSQAKAPTKDGIPDLKRTLPKPKQSLTHPNGIELGNENANIYFVGTATTILEWEGVRIMTDPNFLHAGDHIHLGPGVTGVRQTNPAVDLQDLPRIDLVLLSHYHADHFDQLVEEKLRRDLPIITTPHAQHILTNKSIAEDNFTAVTSLDTWSSALISLSTSAVGGNMQSSKAIRVVAMPGKHVPPGPAGALERINDLIQAVPPTNGWMLELGEEKPEGKFFVGYRIYVSGDTLFVDDLKEIPEKYPHVDLMLVHLGGTTLPGPHLPLLMVTMDATQGLQLLHLIHPDVTIPIHYDDYGDVTDTDNDAQDFKSLIDKAGLTKSVVYLNQGDTYSFYVKNEL